MTEVEQPPQNGIDLSANEEDDNSKARPADIEQDMREMERRKRVEAIMGSKLFREELERIVDSARDSGNADGILQQLSDIVGVPTSRVGSVFKASNCMQPINDIRGVESMGYAKGEKILRCKLAATFRLLDLYGWTKGLGAQITARLKVDQEYFLVNPYGLLYHEITASSLNKVDMQGQIVEQGTTNFGVNKSHFVLHSVVHAARPDIRCAIYIGCSPVVAISSLKSGLLPLTEDACVLGEVTTFSYAGSLYDQEERDKLVRNLGPNSKVMLLTNHGALCCGETIEEAFFAACHIVQACETQLKLLPVGLDNLVLIPEESRKTIYEKSRSPPEDLAKKFAAAAAVTAGDSNKAEDEEKKEAAPAVEPAANTKVLGQTPKWRVGGAEFEALMRMLDNAGYRTGYIYRHPLIKSDPPKPKNDVELPPAVSSLGYLLEEEELFRQGIWKKGVMGKGGDRSRWLNSPNVYQKVEVLETGTPDPKKITKWVAEGSPTHSTPVRIDDPLQFVPVNTNPKEFKRLQQQIKDNRRADKISAGPQSHILEGVTWDEANRIKDATVSQAGDHVVLMGAASKGIIQRGFQHNATVYKAPYAKNPFDNVTDDELNEYKRTVERKKKSIHGEYTDTDFSESEALSSLQTSGAQQQTKQNTTTTTTTAAVSQSEPEDISEHQVMRIETQQAPVPSQPEVVLSDATLSFINGERSHTATNRKPPTGRDALLTNKTITQDPYYNQETIDLTASQSIALIPPPPYEWKKNHSDKDHDDDNDDQANSQYQLEEKFVNPPINQHSTNPSNSIDHSQMVLIKEMQTDELFQRQKRKVHQHALTPIPKKRPPPPPLETNRNNRETQTQNHSNLNFSSAFQNSGNDNTLERTQTTLFNTPLSSLSTIFSLNSEENRNDDFSSHIYKSSNLQEEETFSYFTTTSYFNNSSQKLRRELSSPPVVYDYATNMDKNYLKSSNCLTPQLCEDILAALEKKPSFSNLHEHYLWAQSTLDLIWNIPIRQNCSPAACNTPELLNTPTRKEGAAATTRSRRGGVASNFNFERKSRSPYRTLSHFGFNSPQRDPQPEHKHILPKDHRKYVPLRRSVSYEEIFSSPRYLELCEHCFEKIVRFKPELMQYRIKLRQLGGEYLQSTNTTPKKHFSQPPMSSNNEELQLNTGNESSQANYKSTPSTEEESYSIFTGQLEPLIEVEERDSSEDTAAQHPTSAVLATSSIEDSTFIDKIMRMNYSAEISNNWLNTPQEQQDENLLTKELRNLKIMDNTETMAEVLEFNNNVEGAYESSKMANDERNKSNKLELLEFNNNDNEARATSGFVSITEILEFDNLLAEDPNKEETTENDQNENIRISKEDLQLSFQCEEKSILKVCTTTSREIQTDEEVTLGKASQSSSGIYANRPQNQILFNQTLDRASQSLSRIYENFPQNQIQFESHQPLDRASQSSSRIYENSLQNQILFGTQQTFETTSQSSAAIRENNPQIQTQFGTQQSLERTSQSSSAVYENNPQSQSQCGCQQPLGRDPQSSSRIYENCPQNHNQCGTYQSLEKGSQSSSRIYENSPQNQIHFRSLMNREERTRRKLEFHELWEDHVRYFENREQIAMPTVSAAGSDTESARDETQNPLRREETLPSERNEEIFDSRSFVFSHKSFNSHLGQEPANDYDDEVKSSSSSKLTFNISETSSSEENLLCHSLAHTNIWENFEVRQPHKEESAKERDSTTPTQEETAADSVQTYGNTAQSSSRAHCSDNREHLFFRSSGSTNITADINLYRTFGCSNQAIFNYIDGDDEVIEISDEDEDIIVSSEYKTNNKTKADISKSVGRYNAQEVRKQYEAMAEKEKFEIHEDPNIHISGKAEDNDNLRHTLSFFDYKTNNENLEENERVLSNPFKRRDAQQKVKDYETTAVKEQIEILQDPDIIDISDVTKGINHSTNTFKSLDYKIHNKIIEETKIALSNPFKRNDTQKKVKETENIEILEDPDTIDISDETEEIDNLNNTLKCLDYKTNIDERQLTKMSEFKRSYKSLPANEKIEILEVRVIQTQSEIPKNSNTLKPLIRHKSIILDSCEGENLINKNETNIRTSNEEEDNINIDVDQKSALSSYNQESKEVVIMDDQKPQLFRRALGNYNQKTKEQPDDDDHFRVCENFEDILRRIDRLQLKDKQQLYKVEGTKPNEKQKSMDLETKSDTETEKEEINEKFNKIKLQKSPNENQDSLDSPNLQRNSKARNNSPKQFDTNYSKFPNENLDSPDSKNPQRNCKARDNSPKQFDTNYSKSPKENIDSLDSPNQNNSLQPLEKISSRSIGENLLGECNKENESAVAGEQLSSLEKEILQKIEFHQLNKTEEIFNKIEYSIRNKLTPSKLEMLVKEQWLSLYQDEALDSSPINRSQIPKIVTEVFPLNPNSSLNTSRRSRSLTPLKENYSPFCSTQLNSKLNKTTTPPPSLASSYNMLGLSPESRTPSPCSSCNATTNSQNKNRNFILENIRNAAIPRQTPQIKRLQSNAQAIFGKNPFGPRPSASGNSLNNVKKTSKSPSKNSLGKTFSSPACSTNVYTFQSKLVRGSPRFWVSMTQSPRGGRKIAQQQTTPISLTKCPKKKGRKLQITDKNASLQRLSDSPTEATGGFSMTCQIPTALETAATSSSILSSDVDAEINALGHEIQQIQPRLENYKRKLDDFGDRVAKCARNMDECIATQEEIITEHCELKERMVLQQYVDNITCSVETFSLSETED